jgi:type II secretion system protein G
MKKSVTCTSKRRGGFTLIELVVVVLVLGIIASVAAPKMFDTANDARENSTIQSLAVVRDAIELHRAQNGAYPGDLGTEADLKADLKDRPTMRMSRFPLPAPHFLPVEQPDGSTTKLRAN